MVYPVHLIILALTKETVIGWPIQLFCLHLDLDSIQMALISGPTMTFLMVQGVSFPINISEMVKLKVNSESLKVSTLTFIFTL